MISYHEFIYGPMVVKRGNNNKYMGMYLDLTDEGTFNISMNGYIEKAMDELLKDINASLVRSTS